VYTYSFSGNAISELSSITCHMGPNGVTCHPTDSQ